MAVPALPDTERRTSYSVTAITDGPLDVGFDIYGNGTDYANWIDVWVDGVEMVGVTDWVLDSPSGSLANLTRPITDARITFTQELLGTIGVPVDVQIVGRRQPRRTSQFSTGVGITANQHNQVLTDIIATQREMFDAQRRTLRAPAESGNPDMILPAVDERSLRALFFNAAGEPIAGVLDPIMVSTTHVMYPTLLALASASVADGVTAVMTGGHSAVGDGGHGLYYRLASGTGQVQSADGDWWGLAGPNVNVLQFGADRSGVDDSSAAFQDCAEFVMEQDGGGEVFIPAGIYLIGTRITLSSGDPVRLSFRGEGWGATKINVTAAAGFLRVDTFFAQGDETASVGIFDLHIAPVGEDRGTAIYIEFSGQAAGSRDAGAVIERVRIIGDKSLRHWFDTGIHLVQVTRPILSQLFIAGIWGSGFSTDDPQTVSSWSAGTDFITMNDAHGFIEGDEIRYDTTGVAIETAGNLLADGNTVYVRNPTATTFQVSNNPRSTLYDLGAGGSGTHTFSRENWDDDADRYQMTYAVRTEECYGPRIHHALVANCRYGFVNSGDQQEGGMLTDSAASSVRTGFLWSRTGASSGGWIAHCHFHFRDYGVYYKSASRIKISNCDFSSGIPAQYAANETDDTTAAGPKDIYLRDVEAFHISGCTHLGDGDVRRRFYELDAQAEVLSDGFIVNPLIVSSVGKRVVNITGSMGSRINVVNPRVDAGTEIEDPIGTPAPRYTDPDGDALTVTEFGTANDVDDFRFESFRADANAGPEINLVRSSATPANNDVLGFVNFSGRNASAAEVGFGELRCTATDVTAASEDGRFEIRPTIAGSKTTRITADASGVAVSGKFNIGGASTLTIAAGVVTITRSHHVIDTEAAAASDDLDTINGGVNGDLLFIRPVSDARTVVVKDGTGNIQLPAGDLTLDDDEDGVMLIYDGTNWMQVKT